MKKFLHNKIELKDFEEAKGVVAFYYSAFNNLDLGRDIATPSAFTKTVSENKRHIYHNRDHREAVGAPVSFGQDEKGAYVVSQLGIKTQDGLDCFEQYKAGIIKGHSMEYETVKSSYDEVNDIRMLIECKLWGVTSVTNIPMNLDATTISLKTFKDITEQMQSINGLLKNGNISDECGKLFLKEYDKLQIIATSLKEKLSAGDNSTDDNNEPKTTPINYKSLTEKLTIN